MRLMRIFSGLLAAMCMLCFGFTNFASATPIDKTGIGKSHNLLIGPQLDPFRGQRLVIIGFDLGGTPSGVSRPGVVGHRLVKSSSGAVSVARYSQSASRASNTKMIVGFAFVPSGPRFCTFGALDRGFVGLG